MKKDGFTSLEYLITLFFLTIVIASFGFYIKVAELTVSRKLMEFEERIKIDELLKEIYIDIKNDSTPESDSRIDTVWKWDESEKEGFKINLNSLSGKINLNCINEDILCNSGIRNFFEDSDALSFIINERKEERLIYDYQELKDFISKEDFDRYFTCYGFSNINISDENIIKIISDSATKSDYGNILYNQVRTIRKTKQFIKSDIELKMFLGVNFEAIMPYVNIKPQINVNFMEEDVLRALLSYPEFKLTNKAQRINTLLSVRETTEINEEDLTNILGISKNDELYYYLGCRTWFWQIDIAGKNVSCRVVLARSYEDDEFGKTNYYIIEKKWL